MYLFLFSYKVYITVKTLYKYLFIWQYCLPYIRCKYCCFKSRCQTLPGLAGRHGKATYVRRHRKAIHVSPTYAKLTEDRKQLGGLDRSCFLMFFMSYTRTWNINTIFTFKANLTWQNIGKKCNIFYNIDLTYWQVWKWHLIKLFSNHALIKNHEINSKNVWCNNVSSLFGTVILCYKKVEVQTFP